MSQESEHLWEQQNRRDLLALHEAGHAVVAATLGRGILRVVIATAPASSFAEAHPQTLSKETLHQDLVVLLAGYQSVLKETGDMIVANAQSRADWEYMYERFALLSIGDEEQKIWMRNARPECEKLVESNWESIKKIAAILERDSQVAGTEINKILSDD